MGTYSDWFKKKVVLHRDLQSHALPEDVRSRIHEYLTSQRFRSIEAEGDSIAAVRGRKFFSLFNAGDPRRNYHTIAIVIGGNGVSIHLVISSWFALGTHHDTSVFLAEIAMLDGHLRTGVLDQAPLAEAQRGRRKSDFRTLLLAVVIVILVATGLVAASILTKRLG